MTYSSGNHRRGTGRSIQRTRRPVAPPAPRTIDTARKGLATLRHQLDFAKFVNLGTAVYEVKIAEILAEFPELEEEE